VSAPTAATLGSLRTSIAQGRATLGYLVGGIAFSADDARAMIARGYRFIVLGSDAGLIGGAAQRMVRTIR